MNLHFKRFLKAHRVSQIPAEHAVVAILLFQISAVWVAELAAKSPAGAILVLGSWGVNDGLAVATSIRILVP